MVEQLRLKERISETFGKFVDPRIVANMISGTEEHVDRRVVTVFFSDIAGFTSISEQLTPAAIVNKVNADINEALRDPAILARFVEFSAEPIGGTPAETASYMREEVARWRKVIDSAGVKLE